MSTQIINESSINYLCYYDSTIEYISGSYLAFKFIDEFRNTEKICHLNNVSINDNYYKFQITLTTGSEDLYNGIIDLPDGWYKLNILNTVSGSIDENDSYGTILYDRIYVSQQQQ